MTPEIQTRLITFGVLLIATLILKGLIVHTFCSNRKFCGKRMKSFSWGKNFIYLGGDFTSASVPLGLTALLQRNSELKTLVHQGSQYDDIALIGMALCFLMLYAAALYIRYGVLETIEHYGERLPHFAKLRCKYALISWALGLFLLFKAAGFAAVHATTNSSALPPQLPVTK